MFCLSRSTRNKVQSHKKYASKQHTNSTFIHQQVRSSNTILQINNGKLSMITKIHFTKHVGSFQLQDDTLVENKYRETILVNKFTRTTAKISIHAWGLFPGSLTRF